MNNALQDKNLRRLALGVVRRRAGGSPVGEMESALAADNRRWLHRRSCAAWRRRVALAAVLLALAVALPTAARLTVSHGIVTSTGDPREAILDVYYVLENQNNPMA